MLKREIGSKPALAMHGCRLSQHLSQDRGAVCYFLAHISAVIQYLSCAD